MKKIVFKKPYPKQEKFFKSRAKYTAYGGARGGGKSEAARMKAIMLCLRYWGIQVLFLRRTLPELKKNHLMPARLILKGVAKYNGTDKIFTFPNNAQLIFGYCKSENDVLQYQGQAYDVIFMEEATQFEEFQFQTLTESNRSSGLMNEFFIPRMYFTCNPGGVGHSWVKRLFIDRDYKEKEKPENYAFISAKLYDNEYLLKNSPDYVETLENLPEDRRRAMLDGDWDVFEGQYFPEFRRETHVVEPFPIPREWRRYRVFDYGFDMFACYFIAVDNQNRAYVYKEIYEGKDLGEKHNGLIISEAANRILQATAENEDIFLTFAPPDLWNRRQDTGKSVADIFAEYSIILTKVQNNRVQGWLEMKEWLKVRLCDDGVKRPQVMFFENCVNIIRTLPQLQHSTKDPNDVATEPHELTHGPDAIRYFCSGRPIGAQPSQEFDIGGGYNRQLEDFLNYV